MPRGYCVADTGSEKPDDWAAGAFASGADDFWQRFETGSPAGSVRRLKLHRKAGKTPVLSAAATRQTSDNLMTDRRQLTQALAAQGPDLLILLNHQQSHNWGL